MTPLSTPLPEESVRGMIRLVDSLGREDAGEFMAHDGSLVSGCCADGNAPLTESAPP